MDENILKELNNLQHSDLIPIIIARDVSNAKISKELQTYLNNLFCIQDKVKHYQLVLKFLSSYFADGS